MDVASGLSLPTPHPSPPSCRVCCQVLARATVGDLLALRVEALEGWGEDDTWHPLTTLDTSNTATRDNTAYVSSQGCKKRVGVRGLHEPMRTGDDRFTPFHLTH
jgi:hypothetical protein